MLIPKHLIACPRLADIPDKHISHRNMPSYTLLKWVGAPYLLLQLFSLDSNAQEKRGWPAGLLGLAVVPWFDSTLVFTVVGLGVTLLVVGDKVVVVVVRRVVVALLVVVLRGATVVFCRFTDG